MSAAPHLLSSAVSAVSAEAVHCSPGQVQTQRDASAVAGGRQSPEGRCVNLGLEWGTEGTPWGVGGVCEQAGGLHLSQRVTKSAFA